MRHQFIISSLEELPDIAKQLLTICEGKNKFAFYGEMGTGKTTFIKALSKELGVEGNISSPTFSIVNEYYTKSNDKIFHFDFYRIKSLTEAYDIGYEDYFYSPFFCFIEWAEKIKELLPPSSVSVFIEIKKKARIITVKI